MITKDRKPLGRVSLNNPASLRSQQEERKEAGVDNFKHITFESHNSTLVINVITEELSAPEECHGLRDEIVALVDREQPRNVILNLSRIKFIGSMGLLGFLTLARRTELDRILLCELSENVKGMFVACRLVSEDPAQPLAFGLATTVDDALKKVLD